MGVAYEDKTWNSVSHDCYTFVIPRQAPSHWCFQKAEPQINQTEPLPSTPIFHAHIPDHPDCHRDRAGDPEVFYGDDIRELRAKDIEGLICQLEAANGTVDGVEGKLDCILEHYWTHWTQPEKQKRPLASKPQLDR